jgi:hypothetical protein
MMMRQPLELAVYLAGTSFFFLEYVVTGFMRKMVVVLDDARKRCGYRAVNALAPRATRKIAISQHECTSNNQRYLAEFEFYVRTYLIEEFIVE